MWRRCSEYSIASQTRLAYCNISRIMVRVYIYALFSSIFLIFALLVIQKSYYLSSNAALRFAREDMKYQKMRGTRSKSGTVWPKPQSRNDKNEIHRILPQYFQFLYTTNSKKCPEIDAAISRYVEIIFGHEPITLSKNNYATYLERVYIHVTQPCEDRFRLESSEEYVLQVSDEGIITADTQWGILRGLETFSQLVVRPSNSEEEFAIEEVTIKDFPRFAHRGLMIDTARHFLPVESILKNLEVMSYNKLNVLHWHITDDQSFPILFDELPELAKMGSYKYPQATYSEDDVRAVVEYARMRGIRVIPEIDFPGHSESLAKSHRELLVKCYDSDINGKPTGQLGSLNPINPDVFTFVSKIYSQLQKLFPDEYLHIGGDEVPHDCWLSNPEIVKFINDHKTDDAELQRSMLEAFIQDIRKKSLTPIVWDDGFNFGYTSTPAVVEVWSPDLPEGKLSDLTSSGIKVIVAFPWYLDNHQKKQWADYYADPISVHVQKENFEHVLGGEACMWGEHVDASNMMTDIWPGASVMAERLWSNASVQDLGDAQMRLNTFRCVLKTRNVESSPISPGFCSDDFY